MRTKTQIEPLKVSSKDFTPIKSQMLVLYERPDRSDGGIIYSRPDETWFADVIRVGPDCKVKVGERVWMEMYRGENIDLADGEFTIVDEKQALAVIE